MGVSQTWHGWVRSSWKYTHTGKRVSAGAVGAASLRAVDGDFIAGAARCTAFNVVRVAVVGTFQKLDVCCTVSMSAVMDVKASSGVI